MENATGPPRVMSLDFLKKITNGFSKKVGAGSFGIVYKGEQENEETIAVKVLHYRPELADEEFEKEYLNVASLQHKNVVRLIGYCHETQREFQQVNGKTVSVEVTKRALCFQYMHKGGLDKYLFDEFVGHDWHTRYAIIKGICLGLKYLHEELEPPMYHLDLKPGNVLLDMDMVPKLADFGLSRIFGGERTQMSTSAIGTPGYIPPEYINAGIISNKFDVFSLGVIIIKIVTGPMGYARMYDDTSPQEFIQHVHANWTKRLHATSVHLLDSDCGQVKRCLEIALRCLEADRNKRPTIGLIVNKLNETEPIIGLSIYKICHCISTEKELMDDPLNKLISYPLSIINNRGWLHETINSTVWLPEDDVSTFKEPIQPKIKIIHCTEDLGWVYKIDVHPTEPWILVAHLGGYVSIWNFENQARLMSFDFYNDNSVAISVARFIARKQWLIAGYFDGRIHVYTYTTQYKLKEFQAHPGCVSSLAVHPTDPFVLSSSSHDKLIKLWNWENGWECIRTFQGHSCPVWYVNFNPLTASNTFASASSDGTVKIWSILSDTPITTLKCEAGEMLCSVHYFVGNATQEYIIVGSERGIAHIWDLATETCIRHITGLQDSYSCVAAIDCLPGHPILVTVARDHTVSFCNSTTHRYQNMVNFNLEYIMDLAYSKGTRSLVVAGQKGIAIMEIS